MTAQQQRRIQASGCRVAFDNLTRQLYATDASIYQIEPEGVAFPKSPEEASAVVQAAAEEGIPIIPRGAGTGLVGGAIGRGLILELARHNRRIGRLDLETQTVLVGPGVVLDQLNTFLKPSGFCFGPDVATSSRATLGGMIANNSSGAHVPVYGTTADHVVSLDLVLADGRLVRIGPGRESLAAESQLVGRLVEAHATEIRERMPAGLQKRWPGYGLDRWLRRPGHLPDILAGSEGTLAAIVSAELKIVPVPRRKGLGLLFFASVTEAMQATVALLDLKPAAIEHIDRILLDQTRGQLQFQAARDLLDLDARPCESMLLVEFYEEVDDPLAALESRRLGLRKTIFKRTPEMNLVWALRKAGLSLLTGRPGPDKPVTGIEDAAVPPAHLPDYVAGLYRILGDLGLEACFYGHAATGLLHVRPILDLHRAEDLKKLRQAAHEVSALVRQFKGSLSGEHGVGVARTEFMADQLGKPLLGVMREIKTAFDPRHLFNPGKVIDDGRFQIDRDLRWGGGYEIKPPGPPVLAFAAKDGSFAGNLEQCNGCGGCRKDAPTMCPTFLATGEEIMSTRGRANVIRAVLDGRRLGGADPLNSAELESALGPCLSCKACTTECPSNVNLALLKAELLSARHRQSGLTWRERLFSSVDLLGRWGCVAPEIANGLLDWAPLRTLLARTLGITAQRPLPHYATERFDRWFRRRAAPRRGTRGQVVFWDDTFVRYHEPHIGRAAVKVLEAAGYEVVLPWGRQCCGRPAFSQGNLEEAGRLGRHNLATLTAAYPNRETAPPILFLEPSCYSMFAEDYRELKLAGAASLAGRCFLFEQFIEALLNREPNALAFRPGTERVAIHAHCHAKSLLNPAFMTRLAARLPGREAVLLETGCCGMAGAFGSLVSHYDLSLQVAAPLVEQIRDLSPGTVLVASGTSCRHQIEHLSPVRPRHMAELLAEALADRE
jgi:FAD/FMN-containing dehydrogenase/Fe-S oxidoreductase